MEEPTPNQILTDVQKCELLESQLEERERVILLLDDKNKKIEKQLIAAGCEVVDAMSLEFSIINLKANKLDKKIQELLDYLTEQEDINTTVIRKIRKILE